MIVVAARGFDEESIHLGMVQAGILRRLVYAADAGESMPSVGISRASDLGALMLRQGAGRLAVPRHHRRFAPLLRLRSINARRAVAGTSS